MLSSEASISISRERRQNRHLPTWIVNSQSDKIHRSTATKRMVDFSFIHWERCSETGKPEVSPSNLLRLTAYMTGGVITGVVAGSYVLPFIGIDPSGFVAGDFAATWQASIGIIVAGSPIAILQSLAATGKAGVVLGGVGGGLGALAALVNADKLDWCTCQHNRGKYDHLIKSKL